MSKWRVELVATQHWAIEVEADDLSEAWREAKLAYNICSNPWEHLEPVGDEVLGCTGQPTKVDDASPQD